MITNHETETNAVQHCEQCGLKLVDHVETFLGYCFSCIENETGLKEVEVSFSDLKKQTAAKAYLHYIFLRQHEIKDANLRDFIESTFGTDGGLIIFLMVQAGFIRPAGDFRTSKNYIMQNPPKPVRTWPSADTEDAEEEAEKPGGTKEGTAGDEATEVGEGSVPPPIATESQSEVDPKTGIKLYDWQRPYAHLYWKKVRVTKKKGGHCSGELLGAKQMKGPYVFPIKGLVLRSGKSGRLFKIPLEDVARVELLDHEEAEAPDVEEDPEAVEDKTKHAFVVTEIVGKEYKCGSCSKSFDTVQKLAAHTMKEHRFPVEEFKRLIGEGKTKEEISSIMKRSISAINYHWAKLVAEGMVVRKNEHKAGPAPEEMDGIGKKKEQAPGESPTGQVKPAGGEKGEDEVGIITSRTLETKGPEFREVTRIMLSGDPSYRMRAAIIDSIGYDLKNGSNLIKALSYAVLENHSSRKITLEIEVKKEVGGKEHDSL